MMLYFIFYCFREKELQIHNTDGQQQTTLLREDLPGFIFESNRGTKHSFTAETFLGKLLVSILSLLYFSFIYHMLIVLLYAGPELASGWTDRRATAANNANNANQRRSRLSAKTEALKTQVLYYLK